MATTLDGKLILTYFKKKKIRLEVFARRIYPELLKNTITTTFATELFSQGVIDINEENEAESKPEYQKKKFLYGIIFKKDAILGYVIALEKSGNDHILKILKDKLPFPQHHVVSIEGQEVNTPYLQQDTFLQQHQNNFCQKFQRNIVILSILSSTGLVILVCGGWLWYTASLKVELPLLTIESTARTTFPNGVLTTTEETSIFHDPTLADSTAFDDVIKYWGYTITSPKTVLPPKLPPNTKINLVIDVTQKFDWKGSWTTNNAALVHSLHLIGPFNYSDIDFFLDAFPNLQSLEISSGLALCDQFLGNYKMLHGPRLCKNITSLTLSGISEPCENIYRYLTDKLSACKITHLELSNVSIQFENEKWVRELLSMHREHLISLLLRNVTLLDNQALFSEAQYPCLQHGMLRFFRTDPKVLKETLRNFNNASPNVEKFESTILCTKNEWENYMANWAKIVVSKQDICLRP